MDAGSANDVLTHIQPGGALIVPLANGEPTMLLDAIEAAADRREIDGVTVNQMHALRDRPYLHGAYGSRLHHISYFLSHVTRPCFLAGTVDLVPNHFSEVFNHMQKRTTDPLVIAAASPPDRHGYFSLGVSADYTSSFIGRARFFLEVNSQMPRTFGRNQIHISQVTGWAQNDQQLVEVAPPVMEPDDHTIAGFVAERVVNGACLQTGIGAIPNAIMGALANHRDLGVHTELLSDGLVDLVERGVVNGIRKLHNRTKVVGTFALGTQRLYDFINENTAVEMWSARYVNDPRLLSRERNFVSINATLAVDFLGQCASETLGGHYYSSSGGQVDFARGAMYSEGGKGFIVLRSTAAHGTVSRIVPQLPAGEVVTNSKNTVDMVVTEYGVAELRSRTVRERTSALIAVAHPDHRDHLTSEAIRLGFL
ncbi:MAG TPA: acetyl-CoA hydrolase/transferase C-terminal domain-containing protein [Ilumatobacteraceae bacterium]|nr:acetyl-CoA hydrolase/transferase C-terminal domain-containing protein [Ilumatobacteraceae bacterium]HRB02843.1 acetyl-CoA hydrolase/transferase C-terminal domain-containing protein [Ilumatobacteraceae bacterium]